MRVAMFDDSIPFDGDSPAAGPLGHAEKAFALLPAAFAKAGHEVRVFNRAAAPATCGGARWETWGAERPQETDILIAYRRPELLGAVARAKRRFMWLAGDAAYLGHGNNRAWIATKEPVLVFMSRAHSETYENPDRLRAALIPPGLAAPHLEEIRPQPSDPPHAVCTAHPLHGVDWLVEQWRERIHPILPRAELHLYSAALTRAARGEPVAPSFSRVAALVAAAAEAGVRVKAPATDAAMAEAFRAARAHLHPGHYSEAYCHTIAESQSCGVPAVVRPRGAAEQRVAHNATGFVHAEDDGFAMAVLRLLGDEATYRRMSDQARAMQRGRSWGEAASDFEMHWG